MNIEPNRTARFAKLLPKLGFHWAREVAGFEDIHSHKVRVDGDGALCCEEIDVRLSPGRHEWFLSGYKHARALRQEKNASFSAQENGRVLVEILGIKGFVSTSEELFIFREIFVDETYRLCVSEPPVIWDIGMNVGFASLYFAGILGARVYAYEPFPETFSQAKENISLNPSLEGMISAQQAGIGKDDRLCSVDYVPNHRGSIGVYGRGIGVPKNSAGKSITIQLLNAVQSLTAIRQNSNGRKVFAKVDCEGAEYEIIEALAGADCLKHLTGLMIEWHRLTPDQNPQSIIDIVLRHGFMLFKQTTRKSELGMIYALRTC